MDETKDTMEKKRPLNDLLRSTMDKVHEMVDTNTIVGEPIATADGGDADPHLPGEAWASAAAAETTERSSPRTSAAAAPRG